MRRSHARTAVLAAAVGVGLAAIRPRRVEVAGRSMAPTLLAGDRLVAVRTKEYAVGDIVVVRDPRDEERVLVKRIAALPGGQVRSGGLTLEAGPAEVILLGDNARGSTDSRMLGPVRTDDLVGRCVYRYHPADRVALVRRLVSAPGAPD